MAPARGERLKAICSLIQLGRHPQLHFSLLQRFIAKSMASHCFYGSLDGQTGFNMNLGPFLFLKTNLK